MFDNCACSAIVDKSYFSKQKTHEDEVGREQLIQLRPYNNNYNKIIKKQLTLAEIACKFAIL